MPDARYCKIKNRPDLIRDRSTNAILNADQTAYNLALARKKLRHEARAKSERIEQDIAHLQTDIGDIKNMLKEIINRTT